MKKIYLTLMCCLFGYGVAQAEDTDISGMDNVIYVESFEASPGATEFEMSIKMKNSASIRSFQFDMTLPEGVTPATYPNGNIKCSLTGRRQEGDTHTIAVSLQGDGSYRFLCGDTNDETFTGTDGEVAVLKINISPDMNPDNYPIILTGMKLSETDISKYYETDYVESTLTINNDIRTVLNEESTVMPEEATGVNVRVYRTIRAGVWSTICLPFAMTEAQVKEAFGEDVELGDFKGIEPHSDEEPILSLQVNFSQATSIESNHPYLIKVDDNISSFTVDNVDIAPEEETSVDKDEYRTGSGTKKDPYVYHYNSFIGTYVADFTVPELCLFLNDNKFWYSTGETKMKAFRAYFDFYDVLTEVEESAAPSITLSFNGKDGDVTKIDGRTMEQIETGRVYNTAGQYVGESENINQLPKGVYIVNGKKKVIK